MNRHLALAGGILSISLVLGGLACVALSSLGVVHFSSSAIAPLIVGSNVVVWGSFGIYAAYLHRKLAPKTSAEHVRKEADGVARAMTASMGSRRLGRDLDENSGQLLDEAARSWIQIDSALADPFWKREDLPEHWARIRNQSRMAADQGMDEMMLLLANSLQYGTRPNGFQAWLDDFLSNYLGSKNATQDLPAGFFPARDIAEKLKALAVEVEKSTHEALSEAGLRPRLAGNAIDQVLNEIRVVKQAESELEQQIGG